MRFVDANLSESQALQDVSAVSLDPNDLILYNDSSVRIYFLLEGAGCRNTLGYTTQNTSTGKSRLARSHPDELVPIDDLPKQFEQPSDGRSNDGYSFSGKRLDGIERDAVKLALTESNGNRKIAAEKLGVSEKTVYNLIKRHQLS
ncbi:MAG: transcriptional regulator with GAF, ATPase, and Fis domain [Lentimonas sp.]|jgi:transcriptional regulator with GAF, ATPase, and Fis domain